MSSPRQTSETEAALPVLLDIRHLSTEQLQALGMTQLAYVKPILVDGAAAFAIHAADGTPMAVAGDRDVAFAAIRQHEMMPTLGIVGIHRELMTPATR